MLGNIERAAKSWRDGDDTLAVVYLAQTDLPRLNDPDEAARRLFITDAFIKTGTDALGICRRSVSTPPISRQSPSSTTSSNRACLPAMASSAGAGREIFSFLGDLTATQAEQLGLWATRLLGPTAIIAGAVEVFRTILVPSNNRIRTEGDIKGLPGGHYSWNCDESELHITYRDADGEERAVTARRKGQQFLDSRDAWSAVSFRATQ